MVMVDEESGTTGELARAQPVIFGSALPTFLRASAKIYTSSDPLPITLLEQCCLSLIIPKDQDQDGVVCLNLARLPPEPTGLSL
jgi:hypothetical protein